MDPLARSDATLVAAAPQTRAVLLLGVVALLTLGIDALSGWIRGRMRLSAPGMRKAEPETAEAA